MELFDNLSDFSRFIIGGLSLAMLILAYLYFKKLNSNKILGKSIDDTSDNNEDEPNLLQNQQKNLSENIKKFDKKNAIIAKSFKFAIANTDKTITMIDLGNGKVIITEDEPYFLEDGDIKHYKEATSLESINELSENEKVFSEINSEEEDDSNIKEIVVNEVNVVDPDNDYTYNSTSVENFVFGEDENDKDEFDEDDSDVDEIRTNLKSDSNQGFMDFKDNN